MATSGAYSGHEDLDDDIERLNIVLLADENDEEKESDEELQNLDRTEEEPPSHASHASAGSYASRPSTTSDVTASSFPTTSMGTEAEDLLLKFDPNTFNAESCLAMNRAYQEVLLDTLRQIDLALNENRAKQRELSENLDEKCNKGSKPPKRRSLTDYFTPYFRDAEGGTPPKNQDVHMKAALHESKQYVRPKRGWTKTQRKTLLSAVQLDGLEQQIRPLMNKLEVESDRVYNCKTTEEIEKCKEKIKELKDLIKVKQKMSSKELLCFVDTSKIDFMKISATKLNGRFTALECESMWKNVLQPSINKEKWSKEEEDQLVEIANRHGLRDWQSIAKELGTNRTPFQCLQHFQQNHFVYDTSEWSPEEDALLTEVIDTCQYGIGKVQWYQVAYYMERRSPAQCKARYLRISPSVKHGRWSAKEDFLLATALKTVGDQDWIRVQEFVPQRTAAQCRERWINCLDPNLKFEPWTYEEDKKLIQLYQKYKKNWVAISNLLPGRTDNKCLCRYRTLKKWESSMEHFNSEPLSVKKTLISSFFHLKDDGEIYPNLAKFERYFKKAERKRKKQEAMEPKVEDEAHSDADYMPKEEESHQPADMWEKVAMQGDIQATDYIKQREDKQNGGIVVPRPPPLKRYTIRSSTFLWSRRRRMKKLVQAFIDSRSPEGVDNPQQAMDRVSKSLNDILNLNSSDQTVLEMISKALKGRSHSELSVRQLLEISRAIKNKEEIENLNLSEDEDDEEDDEEDYEDDEDEDDDEELDMEVEREEEQSSDEDFFDYEQPEEPDKPKRVVSEEQKNARKVKFMAHMGVQQQLRDVISRKMAQERNRALEKNVVYQMYPEPSSSSSDPQKLANKSLAILMKSFDVDTKAVYEKANSFKRRQSAMAFLNVTNIRRSTRQEHKRHKARTMSKSEEVENAEIVLALKEELGIGDSDEEPEEDGMDVDENNSDVVNVDRTINDSNHTDSGEFKHASTSIDSTTNRDNGKKGKFKIEKSKSSKDSALSEKDKNAPQAGTSSDGQRNNNQDNEDSYQKVLPYIPPNLSNLRGMKKLLLEHRCLIDTAGGYFDKDELRNHLYNLKSCGPNLLLPVFLSVSKFKGTMPFKEVLKFPNTSKVAPKQVVLKKVRQSKPYQMLKARFQALFVWPALMATVNRPEKPFMQRIKANIEAAKLGMPIQNETVQEVEKTGEDREDVKDVASINLVEEDEGGEVIEDKDDKFISENVAQAVQEVIDKDEENLTHEQAIEKLVEKILAEYKATRETSRKRSTRRSRLRAEEQYKQMVYRRERVKVLKRLGLWETMEKYRLERENQEDVVVIKMEANTDSSEDQNSSYKIISSENQGDAQVIEIQVEKRQDARPQGQPIQSDAEQGTPTPTGASQDIGKTTEIPEKTQVTETTQSRTTNVRTKKGKTSQLLPDKGTTIEILQKNGQDQDTCASVPKKSVGVEIEVQTDMDILEDDFQIREHLPLLKPEGQKQTSETGSPVKRKGRPVGSKNFRKFNTEKITKSERQKEKPPSLPPLNLLGKRPNTPQDSPKNKVKLARLKELIPEKMSSLATKIPDLPLLQEAQIEAEMAKKDQEAQKEAEMVKNEKEAQKKTGKSKIKKEIKLEAEKAIQVNKGRRKRNTKRKLKPENTDALKEKQGGKKAKLETKSSKKDGNKKVKMSKAKDTKVLKQIMKATEAYTLIRETHAALEGAEPIMIKSNSEKSKSSIANETSELKDKSPEKGLYKASEKKDNVERFCEKILNKKAQSANVESKNSSSSKKLQFSISQIPFDSGATSSQSGKPFVSETNTLFKDSISQDIEYVAQPFTGFNTVSNKSVTISTGSSDSMATGNNDSPSRSVLSPEILRAVSANSSKTSKSSPSKDTAPVSTTSAIEPVAMETRKSPKSQVLMAMPITVGDKQHMAYVPISISPPTQNNSVQTSKADS